MGFFSPIAAKRKYLLIPLQGSMHTHCNSFTRSFYLGRERCVLSAPLPPPEVSQGAESALQQGAPGHRVPTCSRKQLGEEEKAVGVFILEGKGLRSCLQGSHGCSLQGLGAKVSP